MEKDKATTSGQSKKLKNTTRPNSLLTNHAVLLGKVRDDLNVLKMAGYFVKFEEGKIQANGEDVKLIKVIISGPEGVELSVVDGKPLINDEELI